ncbi:hypothetical protein BL625_004674 [Escherichia coli]|nr:hypothetical protein [Escherichia coli]HAW7833793.1 hypothetical protein [Escherichia coli]
MLTSQTLPWLSVLAALRQQKAVTQHLAGWLPQAETRPLLPLYMHQAALELPGLVVM